MTSICLTTSCYKLIQFQLRQWCIMSVCRAVVFSDLSLLLQR